MNTSFFIQYLDAKDFYEGLANRILDIFSEAGALGRQYAPGKEFYYKDMLLVSPNFVKICAVTYWTSCVDDVELDGIPTSWFDKFNPDVIREEAIRRKAEADAKLLRAEKEAQDKRRLEEEQKLADLMQKYPDAAKNLLKGT